MTVDMRKEHRCTDNLKMVYNVSHSMTSKYLPTDKSTQAMGKNNSNTPKTLRDADAGQNFGQPSWRHII